MPLKTHPTDPDKMVYCSRQYDIPQLQGVTTTPQRTWVELTQEEKDSLVDAMPDHVQPWHLMNFVNVIEAQLRSKNENL